MKIKWFFGLVLAFALSLPAHAQFGFSIVWDPKNMAQIVQDIQQAKRAYALEQQIHSMIKNPGMLKYMLQMQALQLGQRAGLSPDLMNAANVVILNASRRSAMAALQGAAGISNLTNENATLGSLLGLQAAQASVQQSEIQTQMNADAQVKAYLQRGIGIGPQAAKISNWELK